MKGHYEPRKKRKLSGPSLVRAMKMVRIDARTEIEVPVSISNEDAIERYYQRHKTAIRPPIGVQTEDEIEVAQEELAEAVVDDSVLIEED